MTKKEKAKKISKIKKIIAEWGETTSSELKLSASPCISSKSNGKNNISELVENFNKTSVRVTTYHGENWIDEDDIDYEDLSDEIIDEIELIMDEYNADMSKTMDRCKSENY